MNFRATAWALIRSYSRIGEKKCGTLGRLGSRIQKELGLRQKVFLCEIDLSCLESGRVVQSRELSKFPEIRRDLSFIVDPDADSKLVQGVTFELMGNCGMSFCSPLSIDNKYQLKERLNRYGVKKNMDWNNFDDWLNEIETNTPSINVAAQTA